MDYDFWTDRWTMKIIVFPSLLKMRAFGEHWSGWQLADIFRIIAKYFWYAGGHLLISFVGSFAPWTTWKNWVYCIGHWHWQNMFHNCSDHVPNSLNCICVYTKGWRRKLMKVSKSNSDQVSRDLDSLNSIVTLIRVQSSRKCSRKFGVDKFWNWEMLIHWLTNRWLKECAQLSVWNYNRNWRTYIKDDSVVRINPRFLKATL